MIVKSFKKGEVYHDVIFNIPYYYFIMRDGDIKKDNEYYLRCNGLEIKALIKFNGKYRVSHGALSDIVKSKLVTEAEKQDLIDKFNEAQENELEIIEQELKEIAQISNMIGNS